MAFEELELLRLISMTLERMRRELQEILISKAKHRISSAVCQYYYDPPHTYLCCKILWLWMAAAAAACINILIEAHGQELALDRRFFLCGIEMLSRGVRASRAKGEEKAWRAIEGTSVHCFFFFSSANNLYHHHRTEHNNMLSSTSNRRPSKGTMINAAEVAY